MAAAALPWLACGFKPEEGLRRNIDGLKFSGCRVRPGGGDAIPPFGDPGVEGSPPILGFPAPPQVGSEGRHGRGEQPAHPGKS